MHFTFFSFHFSIALFGILATTEVRCDHVLVDEKPTTLLQKKCESLGCYLSHKYTLDRGYCYHCLKTLGSCAIAQVLGGDAKMETHSIEIAQVSGSKLDYRPIRKNDLMFFYRPKDSFPEVPYEAKECRRHKVRGKEYNRLEYTLVYSHRVSAGHYKEKTSQQIQMKLAYAFAPKSMDRFSWKTNSYVDKNYYEHLPDLPHEYQYGYMKWSGDVDPAELNAGLNVMEAVIPYSSFDIHRKKVDLFEISAPPSFPKTHHWRNIVAKSTCLRVTCEHHGSYPISPDTQVHIADIWKKLVEVRKLLVEVYVKDTAKLKTEWESIKKKIVSSVEEQLERRTFTEEALAIQETTRKCKGVSEKCLTHAKKWLRHICPATPISPTSPSTEAEKKMQEFDKLLFGLAGKPQETKTLAPVLEPIPKLGNLPEGV